MEVVLLEYRCQVVTKAGCAFAVRACGAPAHDGTRRWHGWLEFMPAGDRAPLRTPRETTQPSRAATVYWAEGITPVYLEGALRRAGHQTARAQQSRWRTMPGRLLRLYYDVARRYAAARRRRTVP